MPIYTYRCLSCGHEEDFLVPDMETPKACPSCEGETVPLFPGVNVIYKMAGFYTTDNRKVKEYDEKTGLPKIW